MALIVLVVLALVVATVWLLQRRLIYFPDRSAPPPAHQVVAGAQDVTLRTADGLRLDAWLIRPPPGTPDRRLAVLVAPGNAGNRQGRAPLASALARRGLTVLLVDYRGYGGNPAVRPRRASPTTSTRPGPIWPTPDPRRAAAVLRREPRRGGGHRTGDAAPAGRPDPALTLHRSAGGGPGAYPFLPVRLLARDRFPVRDLVARITVPTLVVYGTADSVVPPAQSAAVAAGAAGLFRVVAVEGADHNDASLLYGDQLIAADRRFGRRGGVTGQRVTYLVTLCRWTTWRRRSPTRCGGASW